MNSTTQNSWAGRIMSGLPALFLLVDGAMKLAKPATVVKATVELGYPEGMIFPLGVVLLVCTTLYLIPQCSVLGAILLTGYLGGAVATHVRVEGGVSDLLPGRVRRASLGRALSAGPPRASAHSTGSVGERSWSGGPRDESAVELLPRGQQRCRRVVGLDERQRPRWRRYRAPIRSQTFPILTTSTLRRPRSC
jgi:hypothetical protein